VTGLSVLVVIICGALASFYIERAKTKLANFLYYMFVIGIALPISVTTTFGLLKAVGLLDTLVGASAIYSAMRLPFVIFIYVGFLKNIPRELDEAAIIDGCGNLSLYFRVIMPLLKPITTILYSKS
jgi:raffinose/stachyose/melibiose transport system permease protein